MCTVYFFFSLNHETFEQKAALKLIQSKELRTNVFLECQLFWVIFLACTEQLVLWSRVNPPLPLDSALLGSWLESWIILVPIIYKENRQTRLSGGEGTAV